MYHALRGVMLTVNNFAILILSSSEPSLTSTIGINFIAVGPHGIMHIANHNIGSSPSIDVCDASPHTIEMAIAGQTINRVTRTRIAGSQGTLPPSSPRFIFRRDEVSVTPATTTCSVTKSCPMFFSDAVSHEFSQPPSNVWLKKTLCRGLTSPIRAPMTAPTSGALKNSDMKDKAACARFGSLFHCFFENT